MPKFPLRILLARMQVSEGSPTPDITSVASLGVIDGYESYFNSVVHWTYKIRDVEQDAQATGEHVISDPDSEILQCAQDWKLLAIDNRESLAQAASCVKCIRSISPKHQGVQVVLTGRANASFYGKFRNAHTFRNFRTSLTSSWANLGDRFANLRLAPLHLASNPSAAPKPARLGQIPRSFQVFKQGAPEPNLFTIISTKTTAHNVAALLNHLEKVSFFQVNEQGYATWLHAVHLDGTSPKQSSNFSDHSFNAILVVPAYARLCPAYSWSTPSSHLKLHVLPLLWTHADLVGSAHAPLAVLQVDPELKPEDILANSVAVIQGTNATVWSMITAAAAEAFLTKAEAAETDEGYYLDPTRVAGTTAHLGRFFDIKVESCVKGPDFKVQPFAEEVHCSTCLHDCKSCLFLTCPGFQLWSCSSPTKATFFLWSAKNSALS
jgi:hypothetical protein